VANDTTFSQILADASAKNIVFDNTKKSLTWFRKQAEGFDGMTSSDLMREYGKKDFLNVGNLAMGKLYFFMYDPKLKEELPYYDLFPCVFPIERYNDGFLGLNFHYLPPALRAKLLDVLRETETGKLPDQRKLQISYQTLKGMTKLFKPCVKRYLSGHLRSKFLNVPYESWGSALFLPVHDFQKASASKVWSDAYKAMKK
jgi:hypothetical protein